MHKYIQTPCNITISGANGSGKTHLIKYMISSFTKLIDQVLIFSNTATFNDDYKKYPITTYIYSPISYEVVLETLIILKRNESQIGYRFKPKRYLVIFDDVCGDIKDSKILKTFITQNRHFNTTIIFSVQYIALLASYMREVSNYDIIFELKSKNSLQLCYDNYYQSDYETFAEFKKNICNSLKQYQFIFADKINHTKQIMKCPKF